MRFALSEDQSAIKRAARTFLDRASPGATVRHTMATPQGFDPAIWATITGELGWTSLPFAESDGGAGLSWVEVVVLMEEMGRALFLGPYFASVCLGGGALAAAGSPAQREEFLGRIATGTTATLACSDAAGTTTPGATTALARRDGDDHLLSGAFGFVFDGAAAELLVVAARAEGSRGDEGVSLFVVPADAPGVSRQPTPMMDQTTRVATLELRDVRVPAAHRLGDEGAAAVPLARALDVAAIALAAEQVGGADRCLDLAVDYAKTRVQFGKPIGTFQAIKHACADMLVDVEMARAAAHYGAYVASAGGDELGAVSAQAKAVASEAYFRCAGQCIQIHGGIGFTWEHDAHLHFKRARATATLLGDAAYHRERYAAHLGL